MVVASEHIGQQIPCHHAARDARRRRQGRAQEPGPAALEHARLVAQAHIAAAEAVHIAVGRNPAEVRLWLSAPRPRVRRGLRPLPPPNRLLGKNPPLCCWRSLLRGLAEPAPPELPIAGSGSAPESALAPARMPNWVMRYGASGSAGTSARSAHPHRDPPAAKVARPASLEPSPRRSPTVAGAPPTRATELTNDVGVLALVMRSPLFGSVVTPIHVARCGTVTRFVQWLPDSIPEPMAPNKWRRRSSITGQRSITTRNSGRPGPGCRFLVDDPQLHPDGLRAETDRLIDQGAGVRRVAEHIDHIQWRRVRRGVRPRSGRGATDRQLRLTGVTSKLCSSRTASLRATAARVSPRRPREQSVASWSAGGGLSRRSARRC